MPVYTWKCPTCGKVESGLVPASKRNDTRRCPELSTTDKTCRAPMVRIPAVSGPAVFPGASDWRKS